MGNECGLGNSRRETPQRKTLRNVFVQASRPLSVQEIFDEAREAIPGLGIATVYRFVKSLVEDGFLASVDIPGEGQRFEVAGKRHHHHFQCKGCGKVFEIDGCAGPDCHNAPPGFEVEDHMVVVYGRCASCKNEPHAHDVHP